MRTAADRLAEIQRIFDGHFAARLRRDFTPEVSAQISANPLGPFDDQCARVVRALGNASVAGKLVLLSHGADGPWEISRIVIGAPGNLVPTSEMFDSHESAAREVFLKRKEALFSSWAQAHTNEA